MCVICAIRKAIEEQRAEDDKQQAEISQTVLATLRRFKGDRGFLYGFLFRFRFDPHGMRDFADALDIDAAPFVIRDQAGADRIEDWGAVYEAIVDKAGAIMAEGLADPDLADATDMAELIVKTMEKRGCRPRHRPSPLDDLRN